MTGWRPRTYAVTLSVDRVVFREPVHVGEPVTFQASVNQRLVQTTLTELRRLKHFATRAEAQARVAAWIDDYNRNRRHSALGMASPIDHERVLRDLADHQTGQAA